MKTFFRRLLTGWILAFALTGAYWGMCLAPANRWSMYFIRLDFWAIFASTLAGGLALGFGAFAVERLFPRAKPLLVASFWAWLALVLANNFPAIHQRIAERMGWPWLTGPVWRLCVWGGGTLGMAAAFRSVRWRNGAARGWWILRRIFWPVVFIVPFSVWRLPSLDAARGTGLDFAKVPGNGKPAMVVLLFDMLGYEELFDGNGNILPAYTNFAAFCETADVFHAAESAGGATATSLPGFILQSRFAPEHRYSLEDWLFTDGTNWFRAEGFALQSLPALARAHGGRAQSIGMYIPWDSILPGVWNATESMAFAHGNQGVHVFGGTPSFWSAVREHASWYLVFDSKSPLGAVFKLAGIGERAEASGYDERVSLVFRARRLFREALSPGDFFFIHVDLPHYPYVVGRDGERLPLSLLHDEDAGLAAQTGGADWALGVWLETIASSPEGRNAWIVVTSDHNLNFGSHLDGRPLRHVPFLVHRPGQTQRRDVSEPADLTDLRHVLPDLPLFAGEGTE